MLRILPVFTINRFHGRRHCGCARLSRALARRGLQSCRHKIYAFIERGEIETVVIGRSRRGKTRSRQAAAPWAEGLRPIPSSQPENKNSPRQLESEAGLSHGIPRRFRILGAAALPQSENHVGQQQCVAFVLRHTIFHKRGFSQINVTTRRRSTSSTGASRELRAEESGPAAAGRHFALHRRCHIVERRTREFCVPNIFKRPRLPRATCS